MAFVDLVAGVQLPPAVAPGTEYWRPRPFLRDGFAALPVTEILAIGRVFDRGHRGRLQLLAQLVVGAVCLCAMPRCRPGRRLIQSRQARRWRILERGLGMATIGIARRLYDRGWCRAGSATDQRGGDGNDGPAPITNCFFMLIPLSRLALSQGASMVPSFAFTPMW